MLLLLHSTAESTWQAESYLQGTFVQYAALSLNKHGNSFPSTELSPKNFSRVWLAQSLELCDTWLTENRQK